MHIPNVSEQSGGGSLIEKGHFILEVSGRLVLAEATKEQQLLAKGSLRKVLKGFAQQKAVGGLTTKYHCQ